MVRVPGRHGAVRLPERRRRRLSGRRRRSWPARGRPLPPAPAGQPPAAAGASRYVRGYSGGAQTRWLESTLAAARGDASIDWIVVQLHQCACSSAPGGDGSDLGVRQEWLPLFDTYEVDLVLSGHDHGYERSFPVRGCRLRGGHGHADRRGGRHPAAAPGDHRGQRGVRHQPGHRAPGPRLRRPAPPARGPTAPAGDGARRSPGRVAPRTAARPPGGAPPARPAGPAARPGGVHQARRRRRRGGDLVRAARRLDRVRHRGVRRQPGQRGGRPDVRHRAVLPRGRRRPGARRPAAGAPTGDYTLFETFTLVRPRSDGRRWHPKDSGGLDAKRAPFGIRAPGADAVPGTSVAVTDVDAVVVGAGVIGLTTAISLAEAGLSHPGGHGGAAGRDDVRGGRGDLGAGALRTARAVPTRGRGRGSACCPRWPASPPPGCTSCPGARSAAQLTDAAGVAQPAAGRARCSVPATCRRASSPAGRTPRPR